MEGKYAIPAFNFNNMEQMQAIVAACVETKSPVILQVSSGARKYANQTILRYMAQGAVEYAKELGCNIPIVLHLDHGDQPGGPGHVPAQRNFDHASDEFRTGGKQRSGIQLQQ